jgi:hypothetical protein
MTFWKRPGSETDLDARLRADRPAARDEFVSALAVRVESRRPVSRRSLGLAIALTVVMVVSLSAFGGMGYASRAIADGYSSATKVIKKTIKRPQPTYIKASKSKQSGQTPAKFQYNGGFHGCTPGYWKQTQHFFAWGGVSQGASFNTTFGVTAAKSGFANSFTLLQALQNGGGGISALGRQAVAAYLNSLRPGMNYPYTTAQVISMVKTAINSGNATTIENTKNQLEAANSLEGPLC